MTRASDTARLVSGGAVFNEASNDVDFRVESNGDANMLFVDAGNDRVYLGRNASDGPALARLQIEAQDSEAAISIHRGSNSSGGPGLFFSKSRGATAGDDTVVQDGDELGNPGTETLYCLEVSEGNSYPVVPEEWYLDCTDECFEDPENDIDQDGICGDEDICPYDYENDAETCKYIFCF